MISYSVAIRTLGTAGEKYEKLLDAIQKQTIKPEKIVVVLPEGYKPPEYPKWGGVEYVYSKKGILYQRIEALRYITSEYIFFCDDDVEPEPNFVEKLSEPLQSGEYDCASGPLLEFFPPKGIKYVFASLLGGACVMLHGRKNNYVRVLGTGGWSYNRSIDVNEHKLFDAQALAGTCFLAKADAMRNVHFEDELWTERNGLALYEDQIMFYKLHINGYKVCVVSDAFYIHNDGKTSTKGLKLEPIYASSCHHYVFWHRFLYLPCKNPMRRLWLRVCIEYKIIMGKLYGIFLSLCGRRTLEARRVAAKGVRDAKKYVKSSEYLDISSVIVRRKE